jgi:hypothetical protein
MTATLFKARVWERGTVTGTGAVALPGVAQVGGFQTFTSTITNGAQIIYGIFDYANNAWEIGKGIYTTSGNSFTRATVIESSNAGGLVSFAGATCDIQVVSPSPVQTSAGSGSQGIPVALNASGLIDNTMLAQVTKNGADGSNIITLSASTTLTAAQSGSTILSTGLTGAATYTLPTNAAGLNYSVYGNGSYAVTITAPAGAIVLPDGTATASYVMPISYNQEIFLVADGTNWRASTTGRAVVAQAVNVNEAVQIGQVLGGVSSNSYSNVSGSRAIGTMYTNSSGRPRVLSIALNVPSTASANGYVNGNIIYSSSATGYIMLMMIVPAGQTYEVTNSITGTITIDLWWEW